MNNNGNNGTTNGTTNGVTDADNGVTDADNGVTDAVEDARIAGILTSSEWEEVRESLAAGDGYGLLSVLLGEDGVDDAFEDASVPKELLARGPAAVAEDLRILGYFLGFTPEEEALALEGLRLMLVVELMELDDEHHSSFVEDDEDDEEDSIQGVLFEDVDSAHGHCFDDLVEGDQTPLNEHRSAWERNGRVDEHIVDALQEGVPVHLLRGNRLCTWHVGFGQVLEVLVEVQEEYGSILFTKNNRAEWAEIRRQRDKVSSQLTFVRRARVEAHRAVRSVILSHKDRAKLVLHALAAVELFLGGELATARWILEALACDRVQPAELPTANIRETEVFRSFGYNPGVLTEVFSGNTLTPPHLLWGLPEVPQHG